ncbi:unnamed protein product [Cladocopium goreaui]|uniref:Uncharacterized protein n=1 Tax=Cladocopium goreaui TaxID=2562237 RepID=A0A9P1DU64_9DINO|nr:unnamed protein product [Cladocopium goreaui]
MKNVPWSILAACRLSWPPKFPNFYRQVYQTKTFQPTAQWQRSMLSLCQMRGYAKKGDGPASRSARNLKRNNAKLRLLGCRCITLVSSAHTSTRARAVSLMVGGNLAALLFPLCKIFFMTAGPHRLRDGRAAVEAEASGGHQAATVPLNEEILEKASSAVPVCAAECDTEKVTKERH